jgi:predicted nucleotidyltransferase
VVNTAQILQQIKISVLATDPGATLILYGSYARGDQREDSDIDILVLIDTDRVRYEDRKRIGNPIYHLELETGLMISPVIFARISWETKHTITPFYKNVTREGKRI